MTEPEGEDGTDYLRVLVGFLPDDHAYLKRRALERKAKGQADASVSGLIRVLIREARAARHDNANERQALILVAEELRRGTVTAREAAALIVRSVERMVVAVEMAGA